MPCVGEGVSYFETAKGLEIPSKVFLQSQVLEGNASNSVLITVHNALAPTVDVSRILSAIHTRTIPTSDTTTSEHFSYEFIVSA